MPERDGLGDESLRVAGDQIDEVVRRPAGKERGPTHGQKFAQVRLFGHRPVEDAGRNAAVRESPVVEQDADQGDQANCAQTRSHFLLLAFMIYVAQSLKCFFCKKSNVKGQKLKLCKEVTQINKDVFIMFYIIVQLCKLKG